MTGEWVARQAQDRDTGRDSRADMRLTLYDRHGRARQRRLTMVAKKGVKAEGDKVLIRFTYPDDIKGTGFLVWEHPSSEDERFLFLPSLGRVRRIAGAEAQESFVGTDFTYEDIGGREFDDYTYALLDDNASWRAPDGASHPAYRLESRRKDASVRFPRVVSLITKGSFVIAAAEVFNRRNDREKVYTVGRLEQVSGIWTALEAEMANALDRTRTTLKIDRIEYNVGLGEAEFTRRKLEEAATR
ncbi:MAG TPA: outer membrane lipoprotein-sorting protein [Vicinamibacterales bacterium]|nr:outer membrane lipoprotein-sorting protein [Vicinamibacterales bacterium]